MFCVISTIRVQVGGVINWHHCIPDVATADSIELLYYYAIIYTYIIFMDSGELLKRRKKKISGQQGPLCLVTGERNLDSQSQVVVWGCRPREIISQEEVVCVLLIVNL